MLVEDFSQLSATDLAYTAGLVDGEGTIGIVCYGRGIYGPFYTMRVRVAMSHKQTIEWLFSVFGGSVHRRSDKRGNRKDTYTVCWSDRRGRSVLRAIYPYLKTKKAQADVAFAFETTRTSRGNDGKRTKELMDQQRAAMLKIQGLNKRGLTPTPS